MIDITNPCGDSENWTSSTNINGGTPGAANSVTDVIPDNFGPEPVQAIATSANQVKIDFTERIDPTAEMIGLVSFEPSLEVASLTFDYLSPKSITVSLSSSLVENQEHQITIQTLLIVMAMKFRMWQCQWHSLPLRLHLIFFSAKYYSTHEPMEWTL